ncbi:MAG: hypothetical protein GXO32_01100 [Crenarchaeota archaeon]|nr:hypothetical protein [Thermoproteota archaeon]
MDIASALVLVLRQTGEQLAYLTPLLLVASVVSAAIQVLVPSRVVSRVMGGGLRSIVLSSVLGLAIPLCSCTVLPIASGLRRSGASLAPIATFVVSAPAISPVSIALSIAILGPRFTALYVATAIASSIAVGLAVRAVGAGSSLRLGPLASDAHCHHCHHAIHSSMRKLSRARAFALALAHTLGDVVPWIALGLAVANAIALLLPSVASRFLEFPMGVLVALAIAAPLYICSVGAIPMVHALLAKGMCVGGAIVMLILGPATNASSMITMIRILGARRGATYIATLMATTLAIAFGIDLALRA